MAKKAKPVTEHDIDACIDLIESVSVHINYRDNRFLNYTKSYASYVTQKSSDKARKKKTSFTFADVISELSPEDKKRLDKEYVISKTKNALIADGYLTQYIPDAKKQIACAFIPFIDEVQRELNLLIKEYMIDYVHGNTGYLYRPKNTKNMKYGMKLVYRENLGTIDRFDENKKLIGDVPSDEAYSFDTLPNLLNTIAQVTKNYCERMDKEHPINKNGKNPRGQVTPLFIRKTCALICYVLLYFGDSLSKQFFNKPLNRNSGVCTHIMNDLHKRTIDLGYEYFNKENKLFEYNKWSILPEVMLRSESYIAPSSPINYAGHKSGHLGYMLKSLVEQQTFKVYVEPFGGSGIGIAQFPKKDGGNYANQCFYSILKKSGKDFNKFLSMLKKVQNQVREVYNKFDDMLGVSLTHKEKKEYYDKWFKGLSKAGYTSTNFTHEDFLYLCQLDTFDPVQHGERFQEFIDFLKLHEGIKEVYKPYKKLYDDVGNHFLDKSYLANMQATEFELAVAFVVLHTSLVSGTISFDQSLVSPPKFKNLDIDKVFISLREAYKNIDIVPNARYGADAKVLLRNIIFNNKDTLVYLDSPYVSTMGYTIGFDIADMIDLLDACKSFQGKFIFSCRVNLPKAALRNKKSKNTFVRFMSEWKNTDYKVLYLNEPFNNINNDALETFKTLLVNGKYNDDYKFLARCIELGHDLELMITNFDFEVPNYQDFLELFAKGKTAYGKEQNKVLVKLDMKDVADLVIYEYSK